MPLYPSKVMRARERAPTPYFSVVFNLGFTFDVATLALGSQPRQGVASLRAKWETQESHHMLSGVQRV
jgi:hypothetical protein